jgi:hypothetical protein
VILRELHSIRGQGEFVFAAVYAECSVASTWLLQGSSVSGFWATASTLLNEMGRWNPDAIERQLAHMEENDVRRCLHACGRIVE